MRTLFVVAVASSLGCAALMPDRDYPTVHTPPPYPDTCLVPVNVPRRKPTCPVLYTGPHWIAGH